MALEQIAGKTANEIDERFGSANFVNFTHGVKK